MTLRLLVMFFGVLVVVSVPFPCLFSCFRRASARRKLCFFGGECNEPLRGVFAALRRRLRARCDCKEQRCSCAVGAATGLRKGPGDAAGGAPWGHSGPITARCGSPTSARAAFERRSEPIFMRQA